MITTVPPDTGERAPVALGDGEHVPTVRGIGVDDFIAFGDGDDVAELRFAAWIRLSAPTVH